MYGLVACMVYCEYGVYQEFIGIPGKGNEEAPHGPI